MTYEVTVKVIVERTIFCSFHFCGQKYGLPFKLDREMTLKVIGKVKSKATD